jgi:hypothetical protein
MADQLKYILYRYMDNRSGLSTNNGAAGYNDTGILMPLLLFKELTVFP